MTTMQSIKKGSVVMRFIGNRHAAVAAIFGLLIPVVITAAGMGVDLTKAYMVRDQLARALDASALAAASASSDEQGIKDKFHQFFDKNFDAQSMGVSQNIDIVVTDDLVTVRAEAVVPTSLMYVAGFKEVTVAAYTEVKREVRGIEVGLVLDVTGSMGSYGRIDTLKTAANNFIDILYEGAGDNPEGVKIAIIPYATTVNVGPYGLGKDPDGFAYGTPFVNDYQHLTFNQGSKYAWWGCVLAQPYPDDTEDADSTWRWDAYDASDYPRKYPYDKNYNCNKSYILPLSSNQDAMHAKINSLYANGYTLGNIGMVWGYRVLSPDEPFTEGAAWDDSDWKKIVIMMTDGNNTMTDYTAYGSRYYDHNLGVWDLNNRMGEVCENMKQDGIIIYTVTFDQSINQTTKDIFEDCATDSSKYYDAPTQSELIEVFEKISRELANLHIQQ